jgi:hypothetical protein
MFITAQKPATDRHPQRAPASAAASATILFLLLLVPATVLAGMKPECPADPYYRSIAYRIAKSEVIVLARALTPTVRGNRIPRVNELLRTSFAVEQQLKGTTPARIEVVDQMHWKSAAERFQNGERVILFLSPDPDHSTARKRRWQIVSGSCLDDTFNGVVRVDTEQARVSEIFQLLQLPVPGPVPVGNRQE